MTRADDHADIRDKRVWERGWDDHERAQAERLAKLPLAEKLKWLEEMQGMIDHMAKQKQGEKSETD